MRREISFLVHAEISDKFVNRVSPDGVRDMLETALNEEGLLSSVQVSNIMYGRLKKEEPCDGSCAGSSGAAGKESQAIAPDSAPSSAAGAPELPSE